MALRFQVPIGCYVAQEILVSSVGLISHALSTTPYPQCYLQPPE